MIPKELVETAIKNSGAKRISHILHGRSVLEAYVLNIDGADDAKAFDAHTAAAAFATVAESLQSKKGLEFAKSHCFVGFHDEVLCLNMPEPKVIEFLQGIKPPEAMLEDEAGGGVMAKIKRSVRKVVKQ